MSGSWPSDYMFEPVEVNLSQDEPSVETIQQYYISVNTDQKFDLLLLLLKRDRPRQCIVFTRTKRGADRLADRLHRVDHGRVRHPRRSSPDHARPRDARVSRAGRSRSWSPPTSSAAASMSRASAM